MIISRFFPWNAVYDYLWLDILFFLIIIALRRSVSVVLHFLIISFYFFYDSVNEFFPSKLLIGLVQFFFFSLRLGNFLLGSNFSLWELLHAAGIAKWTCILNGITSRISIRKIIILLFHYAIVEPILKFYFLLIWE